MLGGGHLAAYIDPSYVVVMSLLALSFPYVFFVGLPLTLVCYSVDKKMAFILFVALVLSIPAMLRFFSFKEAQDLPMKNDLVVMSYNIMMGAKMTTKESTRHPEWDEFKKILLTEPRPDVICLQEVSERVEIELRQEFPELHIYKTDMKGAAIVSRYPILRRGVLDNNQRRNGTLWVDISIRQKTVRIYNIHLQSNHLSLAGYDNITEPDASSERVFNGLVEGIKKYARSVPKRAEQGKALKEHMHQSPHPVIACGDFNDSPMSFAYRHIRGDLSDAFLSSGHGWGTTWRGRIPLLRIDYILYDQTHFMNTAYSCDTSTLSDHNPTKATFNWY